MADEVAGFDVGDFAGADPFALIVGGEPSALGTDGQAGGRPQAGGDGRELAVGRDLDHPAAPRHGGLRGSAKSDIEGDAEIAVGP